MNCKIDIRLSNTNTTLKIKPNILELIFPLRLLTLFCTAILLS